MRMPRRPPKKWFYKMIKRIKRQYPEFSAKKIKKIVGGAWYHRYSKRAREKLTGEIERVKRKTKRKINKKAVLKAIKSLRKRSDKKSKRLVKGLIKYAKRRGWL